ncbi:MAG TPA: ACT domain-containing protein [Kiritimatiellia bacterium]|nr:ACT domain-containing protein [Kiritimatiellia bacterium]HRZ12476.1 ACT domain-containing protein [Kiritimatiellia bacterium]HSA17766.1 ACT domain-containing protein [Kiritimatiellia bacterium]
MKVRQLSIFMENRAGRLAEIMQSLGDAGINIRALSLADTSDFGILRLIVSQVDKALEVLRKAGHTVSLTDVVAVEVPDHPGGLASVLTPLREAGVNVEYMYAFVEKATDKAVVIFRFEETEAALKVLAGARISVLPAETVYKL